MKNILWTFIAVAVLGAMGTTPAYAGGSGGLCNLPFIGKYLCPPQPGGGGGPTPVPEPASLVVLGIGAAAAGIAARRRGRKQR